MVTKSGNSLYTDRVPLESDLPAKPLVERLNRAAS